MLQCQKLLDRKKKKNVNFVCQMITFGRGDNFMITQGVIKWN